MIILRNIAFVIVFFGLSVPIVGLAPVVALFGRRAIIAYTWFWAWFHHHAARLLLGIRPRIEGDMAMDGPVLYAAKHQAMYETIEIVHLLGNPVVVMKEELAQIPVWGWTARRYGCIVVDRTASAAALRRLLRESQAAIAAGRPVVIFPEGTRVPPGETPPLKPGFVGLYQALKLPVVPIALDSGRLWPRRGLKRPGIVTFRFAPAIPTGSPRAGIEARVHEAINVLERAQPLS